MVNPHFVRHGEDDQHSYVPESVWAHIDHVELPGPGQTELLVGFDCIEESWITTRARQDDRFDLDNPTGVEKAWTRYWAGIRNQQTPPNPFDTAKLYRVEMHIDPRISPFDLKQLGYSDSMEDPELSVANMEGRWIKIKVSRDKFNNSWEATLYGSLYSAPTPVWVTGTMPTAGQSKSLSTSFSIAGLPRISATDFASKIAIARANYLAAYDVGQGNCNALLNQLHFVPTLYYDLGAGVYRNKKTTPAPLVFCYTGKPTIILSHWDSDHWAGTYAVQAGGAYVALQQSWIAPLQKTGPVHLVFAHDVISNGGSFLIYSPPPGTIGKSILASGHTVIFAIGSGPTRNHSGIVLAVEHPGTASSWILTGDCDYKYFPSTLTSLDPVAIVAPHHGATLTPSSPIPSPKGLYRRIVYSFGSGNSHGRGVSHPTVAGVSAHDAAGWNRGAWLAAAPGVGTAGGDSLATQDHGPPGGIGRSLGGAIIGWSSKPSVPRLGCGAASCTIALKQA